MNFGLFRGFPRGIFFPKMFLEGHFRAEIEKILFVAWVGFPAWKNSEPCTHSHYLHTVLTFVAVYVELLNFELHALAKNNKY